MKADVVGEGLENEAEARECREESREVAVFRGTVVWEGRRVSGSGGEEIVRRSIMQSGDHSSATTPGRRRVITREA